MNKTNVKSFGKEALVVLLLTGICVAAVHAGQDNREFTAVYTLLQNWATGTLGKIIALGALIVGIGFGLVRQSVIAAVIGIAMAMVLSYGPDVIDKIFTASAYVLDSNAIGQLSNFLM